MEQKMVETCSLVLWVVSTSIQLQIHTSNSCLAPFAAVKLGPDLDKGDLAKSGYMPSGNINGFSMMHESGTGGSPKYGTISQMPVLLDNPVNYSVARTTKDVGSVGYYKSSLSNGITVELAGTSHTGMFQYTFPP